MDQRSQAWSLASYYKWENCIEFHLHVVEKKIQQKHTLVESARNLIQPSSIVRTKFPFSRSTEILPPPNSSRGYMLTMVQSRMYTWTVTKRTIVTMDQQCSIIIQLFVKNLFWQSILFLSKGTCTINWIQFCFSKLK